MCFTQGCNQKCACCRHGELLNTVAGQCAGAAVSITGHAVPAPVPAAPGSLSPTPGVKYVTAVEKSVSRTAAESLRYQRDLEALHRCRRCQHNRCRSARRSTLEMLAALLDQDSNICTSTGTCCRGNLERCLARYLDWILLMIPAFRTSLIGVSTSM